MEKQTFEVKGLLASEAKLGKLSDNIARKIFRKAGNRAGGLILRAARRRTPLRTGELRGNLAKSIKIKSRGVKGARMEVRIGARTDGKRRGVVLRFLEGGTEHIAAIDILQGALDATASAAVQLFAAELERGLASAIRPVSR